MVKKEPEHDAFEGRLDTIKSFVTELYIAGGIPLVIIGLGAVNMFIP